MANVLRVVVSSTNPVKQEATRLGFQAIFPSHTIEIDGGKPGDCFFISAPNFFDRYDRYDCYHRSLFFIPKSVPRRA